MAIKKRVVSPSPQMPETTADAVDRKASEFGKAGYAPKESPAEPLDPNAPVGPQGILFRFNDYQKQLLKSEADADRRSQQKLLESILWPELERRKAERNQ